MELKVGDMVKYQDQTVRVLRLDTEAPNCQLPPTGVSGLSLI